MNIVIPASNLGFYLTPDNTPVISRYRDVGEYSVSMDDLIMRSSIRSVNGFIDGRTDTNDCLHSLLSVVDKDSVYNMDICDTIYYAVYDHSLDLCSIEHNAYFNIKYLLSDYLETSKEVIIVADDDYYVDHMMCYSDNVIVVQYKEAINAGYLNFLIFEIVFN